MKRKLAATTSLGPLPVRIYKVEGLQEEEQAAGRFVMKDGVAIIELEADQTPILKHDALLHELIHVADELWDLGLSERKVRELGTSLCQALNGMKKA